MKHSERRQKKILKMLFVANSKKQITDELLLRAVMGRNCRTTKAHPLFTMEWIE